MNILAITRAPQFSPNSVENDRAIMQAVTDRLARQGHDVATVAETELAGVVRSSSPSAILSMGRLPETLEWLSRQQCRTINTPQSVAACSRSSLARLMQQHHIPMAPETGDGGYWLKRGDSCAQRPADVIFCRDAAALAEAKRQFVCRGVRDYVVSAHVEGDLIKFYGVRGMGFFRCFYPTDDGLSKFGNERLNGQARHYAFSQQALHHDMERLAALVGIDVYGGDCIVRADGSYCVIDFNDWPSFSCCRDEAAEAIVSLVMLGR